MPGVPDWVLRRVRTAIDGDIQLPADGSKVRIRPRGGRFVTFYVRRERPVSEERVREFAAMVRDPDPATSPRRVHVGFSRFSHIPTYPVSYLMLATDRLTPASRSILRAAGISWLEEQTAVSHVVAPGIVIDIDPHSPPTAGGPDRTSSGRSRPARLRRRTGVCAETMLLKYRGPHFRAKDLAHDAGLSPALVSRVLIRLANEGIVEEMGNGPRWKTWRLSNPGALLDRWAEEEVRPEVITRVYAHAPSYHDLYARITKLGYLTNYAVGGVGAANLWAPLLTTDPRPDVWIPAAAAAEDIARELGGTVVESGENIHLWQTSSDPALVHRTVVAGDDLSQQVRCVNWPRAYVEARRARGRGGEVADHLRARSPLDARA
jgi:hypothetical protein